MAGLVYIADGAGALLQVELGGLTAFYHRPSGITHILAPPAPQILAALADRPGGVGDILARLAAEYEISGTAAGLQARLDELVAAGLIYETQAAAVEESAFPASRAA